MHSCKFCYYSFLDGTDDRFKGMRKASFRPLDDLKKLIDSLSENKFCGFDATGGEPTLHPDIIEIIRYATEKGLATRIITLGQYLMRRMRQDEKILIDGLLDAGVTNFLFSMHSVDEELFGKITGESWIKQRLAMDALDRKGFDYCSNTTVFEENYKQLPKIAQEILKHNIYLHNFILMNAYYEWSEKGRAAPVQAKYSDVYPYLREAVEILDNAGVGVNIRYAPLCSVSGLEKHVAGIVGVRHDPYEWNNMIVHSERGADGATHTPVADPIEMGRRISMDPSMPAPGAELIGLRGKAGEHEVFAGRGAPGHIAKVFPSRPCQECKAVSVCDGVDGRYIEERGPDEFAAYNYSRGRGPLDDARLKYKAPFFVKLKPDAKIKDVVRKSIRPEPLKENPLVVVIVTWHEPHRKFLQRALDSVLAQTYRHLQVFDVYDDGSFGQPASARNAGIEKYAADLIVCLDADDWIEPAYILECVAALQEHPEASIAYTQTRCFGDSDELWPAAKFDYGTLIHGNQFSYCAMYKREVWDAVGGYKTNVRGCEDFNFWIAAAGLGYTAIGIEKPLFNYRRNKEGIFEQDVIPNFSEKFKQIVLNNRELYPVSMVKEAERGAPVNRVIE